MSKGKTKEWLRNSITSAGVFILGFILGTIIDIFFYQLYIKWDPKKTNLKKLLVIITIQILFFTTILSFENTFSKLESLHGVIFRLSLVMSQIFMVNYALGRISDIIYHRDSENQEDEKIFI